MNDSKFLKSLKESRKIKKILSESNNDEIRVYMNTWANYNENGADLSAYGINSISDGWMTLEDAKEFAKKYAEDEPFINDTDNVPEAFNVNEYSGLSVLDDLIEFRDADLDMDIVEAIMDCGYNFKDACEKAESGDYIWYPEITDSTDLAYKVVEESGGISSAVSDPSAYIDEDAMRRDFEYDVIDILISDAERIADTEHDDEEDFDKDEFIDEYVDENLDSYLDSVISKEVAAIERGDIENTDYFDYEAFGRDLAFDYTFTDKGAIRVD